jgi:large subunit ribosomal protein L11
MQFVKEYNDRTASMAGSVVPVQLTVFEDRSFSFITKTAPASELIKQQAKVEKGSATAGKAKIGTVDRESVRRIAQTKLADLNSNDIEGAMRMIEGTARSMGIEVVESHDKGAKSA